MTAMRMLGTTGSYKSTLGDSLSFIYRAPQFILLLTFSDLQVHLQVQIITASP